MFGSKTLESNFLVLFLVAATEKKDKEEEELTVAVPAKKPKPAAAKAAAVAKPLRQMMEEDVIPPLIAILESQDDISEIDLSFQEDNKVSYFLLLRQLTSSSSSIGSFLTNLCLLLR